MGRPIYHRFYYVSLAFHVPSLRLFRNIKWKSAFKCQPSLWHSEERDVPCRDLERGADFIGFVQLRPCPMAAPMTSSASPTQVPGACNLMKVMLWLQLVALSCLGLKVFHQTLEKMYWFCPQKDIWMVCLLFCVVGLFHYEHGWLKTSSL